MPPQKKNGQKVQNNGPYFGLEMGGNQGITAHLSGNGQGIGPRGTHRFRLLSSFLSPVQTDVVRLTPRAMGEKALLKPSACCRGVSAAGEVGTHSDKGF